MTTFADLDPQKIWVAWQGEPDQDGKIAKVPYWVNGRIMKASSTDPSNWGTRDQASLWLDALPKPCSLHGVGVVMTQVADLWICGVDLDTCVADGQVAPWASEVVHRFGSYTEVSPSDTGVKIFFLMRKADRETALAEIRAIAADPEVEGTKWARATGGAHPPAIELFLGKRFFTVTGIRVVDTPEEMRVVDIQDVLWLIRAAGPAFVGGKARDGSRSAVAFRKGLALVRRGASYAEMREALLADPETAEWVKEKGLRHGERELKRIFQRASGPPWEIDTRAPYDTARLLLAARHTTPDGHQTFYRHRGGFYSWAGPAWPEVDDAEVRASAYAFLDECIMRVKNEDGGFSPAPVKPNARLVSDLLDALRAAALLPDAVAAPAWLEPTPDLEPRAMLSCANGLLHLPTLDLLPHTPAFFTHNAHDYPFEPDAPKPVLWLAFIKDLWKDDAGSIETLQEIFGYALVADTSLQKAFLLIGPKRSGKGTIARVLARLIGAENAVAPTLASLGTNFGLQPLIGKRVAIISDARLGGRADLSAVTERLLSITGEDNITIDRKYREAWTGRLQARFLVLTNELPRFNDASGALASRFIVLVLTKSFFGKEDPGLTDILLTELPGILNWAIKGWERLQKRGYFVQPASALDAVEEVEALGSPIKAFAADRCVLGPEHEATSTALFWAWQQWCQATGRERSGTIQSFFRDLNAAFQLKKEFRRVPTPSNPENRVRYYLGVGLQTPVPTAMFDGY